MNKTPRPQILLIEDNPGDILLFRIALSEAGIDSDVQEIRDGRAALDYVRQEGSGLPDLVVLDLNLPKADGREILTAMRANPLFQSVPVIIWTSSNARTDREHFDNLSVARYVVKPPEFEGLVRLGKAVGEVLHGAEPSAAQSGAAI